jgi:predicted RNase H-like HicB family nuclease
MSNGWYFAKCEQLPGAMTQGMNIEEAKENLKEAIQLILECEAEDVRNEYVGRRFIRRKLAVGV